MQGSPKQDSLKQIPVDPDQGAMAFPTVPHEFLGFGLGFYYNPEIKLKSKVFPIVRSRGRSAPVLLSLVIAQTDEVQAVLQTEGLGGVRIGVVRI